MKSQRGQVLIVAILILLVVSFIILATASRTITDIKISETSDESQRAFFAAETGVEEAMEQIRQGVVTAASGTKTLPNQSDYAYSVSPSGSADAALLLPSPLTSDIQTFQVYLANRDDPATAANELDTGNYAGAYVCLQWGNPAAATPAIEATVVYKRTVAGVDTVVSTRFAIDPDATRIASNNFAPVSAGAPSCPTAIVASENNLGIDRTFAFAHKLELNSVVLPSIASCGAGAPCVYYLRMRLLYSQSEPQYVGVSQHGAGFTFPPQGYKISSTGNAGGATGATRKMEIFRFYESLPSVFDFALFNGCTSPPSCSDVIKN